MSPHVPADAARKVDDIAEQVRLNGPAAAYAELERALHAFLAAVPVVEVRETEWRAVAPANALADLDTPDDFDRHVGH